MSVESQYFVDLEKELRQVKKDYGFPELIQYAFLDLEGMEVPSTDVDYALVKECDAALEGSYHFEESFGKGSKKKLLLSDFVDNVVLNTEPDAQFEAVCLATLLWQYCFDSEDGINVSFFSEDDSYRNMDVYWNTPFGENDTSGGLWIDQELVIMAEQKSHLSQGNTEEYIIENGALTGVMNRRRVKEAFIPYGITTIGSFAFENCKSLKKVSFPDTIIAIWNYAFSGCSSLEEVEIPSSVNAIGSHAFFDCSHLKSISIPEGVVEIPQRAFAYCESLESIPLPSSLTAIRKEAFEYCQSIKEIRIPESVTYIGEGAFTVFEKDVPSTANINFYAYNQHKIEEEKRVFHMPRTLLAKYSKVQLRRRGIRWTDTIVPYGEKPPVESKMPPFDFSKEYQQDTFEVFHEGNTDFEVHFLVQKDKEWLEQLVGDLVNENREAMDLEYSLECDRSEERDTDEHLESEEAVHKFSAFLRKSMEYSKRNMLEEVLRKAVRKQNGKLSKGRVQILASPELAVHFEKYEFYAKNVSDNVIQLSFRERYIT